MFDIDGTLIRWQLYHAVVDRLAKHGLLGDATHKKIHEARMVWKKRSNDDAFNQYEHTLIEAFESALSNINPTDFDKLVDDIIDEYKDQVYIYTRDLIKRLKQDDYFLIAISGSHQELVDKLGEYYDFDIAVGSRYERDKQSFNGKKFIASLDKKSVLQKIIAENNLTLASSIAVGDTKSDTALLLTVEQPIAFNPERILFKYAQEKDWSIVIERKNVIYELKPHNGRYILA